MVFGVCRLSYLYPKRSYLHFLQFFLGMKQKGREEVAKMNLFCSRQFKFVVIQPQKLFDSFMLVVVVVLIFCNTKNK